MASTREARRGPPLTQEEIVTAAVAIADADGLEAVSMRRLAGELGVGAMTLYHHVEDKRALLLLMMDQIASEMLIPGTVPADWREALRQIAERTHATLTRHVWMLDSLGARPGVSRNWLMHIEQSAAAVENLDVDPRLATTMVMATDDYTIGFVIRNRRARDPEFRRRFGLKGIPPEMQELLDTGEFPHVASFVAEGRKLEPPEGRFEEGLEWLFDGMERMLEREARG